MINEFIEKKIEEFCENFWFMIDEKTKKVIMGNVVYPTLTDALESRLRPVCQTIAKEVAMRFKDINPRVSQGSLSPYDVQVEIDKIADQIINEVSK